MVAGKSNKLRPIEEVVELVARTTGFQIYITPIEHAISSFGWDGTIIYVDPVAARRLRYVKNRPNFDYEHSRDHFSLETLQALITKKGPKYIVKKL